MGSIGWVRALCVKDFSSPEALASVCVSDCGQCASVGLITPTLRVWLAA